MVPRPGLRSHVTEKLGTNPVVALLGPRQCGKTTLARQVVDSYDSAEYFDLENPVDNGRLAEPMQALGELGSLVVIDEIQRMPGLFEVIRVLVDRPAQRSRFLVLGSASPQLVKGVSESLAGRVAFVDMAGFDLDEVGDDALARWWNRGGLPRSFLGASDRASFAWRQDFVRTFLERDIPQLGINVPAETLRRFWTMVAHYHGQIWNAAEFARSLGASEPTARRYLDILSGSYVVRALPPWHESIKKRQVRSPKVYVRDSGVLHALLSLETMREVRGHPKLGASWEGLALEHVCRIAQTRDVYFWATHTGAELDLLVFWRGKRIGFEFKYTDAPAMTKSLASAMTTLSLDRAYVVYPGDKEYPVGKAARAIPLPKAGAALARR
jgi:predicted AAA+ superfamily ATPase